MSENSGYVVFLPLDYKYVSLKKAKWGILTVTSIKKLIQLYSSVCVLNQHIKNYINI